MVTCYFIFYLKNKLSLKNLQVNCNIPRTGILLLSPNNQKIKTRNEFTIENDIFHEHYIDVKRY